MRIFALLFLLDGFAAQPQAVGWKLVWSDEFDKPGWPDPSKWTYEEGFIRNNELQFYTRNRPENARVENGLLIIEARRAGNGLARPWEDVQRLRICRKTRREVLCF
ncbi:MAG: hypothetical protein ABSH28_03420 [Acidobacteriota bacterium]